VEECQKWPNGVVRGVAAYKQRGDFTHHLPFAGKQQKSPDHSCIPCQKDNQEEGSKEVRTIFS